METLNETLSELCEEATESGSQAWEVEYSVSCSLLAVPRKPFSLCAYSVLLRIFDPHMPTLRGRCLTHTYDHLGSGIRRVKSPPARSSPVPVLAFLTQTSKV